ncbi:MAG: FapA family protein, partial [Lachnospiraceae bacterium]|nr:FapA family protein [Lachnospiraceae bacterium]
VEAGVVIRAGRNIEIKGTVEAVNLFAGGDVVLTKGIQGAQRAKISARGNIFADFIEHTVVVAGGNVQANTILNSRISSDGQVILTGNKGAIIGGYTHAMMGISATEIGNPAEVRTIVHVGSEKEVYTRLQTVKATETEQSTELQELSETLSDLLYKKKAANGKIPDIMESRIKNLEGRAKALKKEIEENRVEREKCEAIIAKGRKSEIVINGNVYRGTVVCLAQIQMPIERSTCYMKYYQERGMIESSVIAYS